ncbi:hypothetical protein IAT40_007259 [Kwoniella sp. CBS 6097]
MIPLLLITAFRPVIIAQVEMEYYGCFDYRYVVPGFLTYNLLTPGQPPCNRYCITQGNAWAYDFSNFTTGSGVSHYCACADNGPLIFEETGDRRDCNEATEASPESSDVQVFIEMPSWDYVNCYEFDAPPGIWEDDRPASCEIHCFGNQFMLRKYFFEGDVLCTCVDSSEYWQGLSPSNCEFTTSWYVYKHIPLPSSAAKRHQRRNARQSTMTLCPEGFKACNIFDGQGLSYECLDVQQELESCGGCLHGEIQLGGHHVAGVSAHGVDCTMLPGAEPRGMTCQHGQCIAYSCEEGFILEDGVCEAA